MGPYYCPLCLKPWYACTCRRHEEPHEKYDVSFTCMMADTFKFDMEDDTMDLTKYFAKANDIFDGKKQVKEKVDKAKRFYLENFNSQINLNFQIVESFKLSKIPGFDIGFKYKNLVENMDDIATMTQLVNERIKIKFTCKTLFYRESALKNSDEEIRNLSRKYVGIDIDEFKEEIEKEVEMLKWVVGIYQKRFMYIRQRLEEKFHLTDVQINGIQTYENVVDFYFN